MRDFFTEVGVVAEERKMRVDNSPQGVMLEKFLDLAYDDSPYKTMVIGPAADIQNYTPALAKDFYKKYYTADRIVVALVGNFDLDKTEKIVRKYFGAVPKAINTTQTEPLTHRANNFPRRDQIVRSEKPRFYLGYHRPSYKSDDDLVLDFVQNLLCNGRVSRLYKKLVLDDKKATTVVCYSAFPGVRLNTLFLFYAMPHDEYSNDDLLNAIKDEVKMLATQGPTPEELQRVKNNMEADLVYSLQSNGGLASQLSFYETLTGDWQYMLQMQKRFRTITAAQIQAVMAKYFVPEHEVMMELVNK